MHLSRKVVGVASLGNDRVGNSRVTVETDTGTMQTFDEVVVTLPLGCLKRGKIFSPPLTPSLTAAIDAISVGHLEKARDVTSVASDLWIPS
jgi:monoamine oxidase